MSPFWKGWLIAMIILYVISYVMRKLTLGGRIAAKQHLNRLQVPQAVQLYNFASWTIAGYTVVRFLMVIGFFVAGYMVLGGYA